MPKMKFYNGTSWITLDANDADTVDGKHASDFATSTHNHDTVYSKLGHTHDDRYYTETEVNNLLASKLSTTAKAADSDKLDGLDSVSFLRSDADDTFSGALVSSSRNSGIFGTYDSTKTDQVWSMGTAYRNDATGATFGNLYGMAYKHTNNTTGGTMAGGHQIVFVNNGTAGAAIGLNGNIWTSGTVYEGGTALNSKYAALSHSHAFNSLSDVTISSPATGHTTRYNGTAWVNAFPTMNDNSDITLSTPASGHVLQHDGAKWVNRTLYAAGIAAHSHNHDGAYVNTGGDTMTGNLVFSGQTRGIHISDHVANTATPTHSTSGNVISAGSDIAGLTKLNNVAVQTWWGFSVSPTVSGQAIAQGKPAFSVDARAGHAYVAHTLSAFNVSVSQAGLKISGNPGGGAAYVAQGHTFHTSNTDGSVTQYNVIEYGLGASIFRNNHVRIVMHTSGTRHFRMEGVGGEAAQLQIGSTIYSSDRNIKKNIVPYAGSGLAEINNTEVKQYHMLDDLDTEPKRLGIILQEAPIDVVAPTGGVDSYAMIAMAWKAIQELNTKLDTTNTELAAVKAELEAMKTAQ